MNAPLFVTPAPPVPMPELAAGDHEVPDLLRQLIDVQREQVSLLKTQVAAQDGIARWRAFLSRWAGEFPDIGGDCKRVLPLIERAYLTMIREMTDRLKMDEPDDLGDEFVLNEFLDRYGIRLAQLGNILSQISPLADAAPATPESA